MPLQSPECLSLRSELEKIQALKQEFDAEFETAVRTGKPKRAQELKNELKQRVADLREKIEPSEFREIREREVKRNSEFFGEGVKIEIPPLPKGITKEMVENWKEKGFRLEYWPNVDLSKKAADENKFPGWHHKPGKEYTPDKQYGIDFYGELTDIQNLPENKDNLKLIDPQTKKPYKLTELPGCWVLQDIRPKPDDASGKQSYENDTLIQEVLKKLADKVILNKAASACLRNNIHPDIFKKPKFWLAIKEALNIDPSLRATLRLPRLIEQNYRGQGDDFHKTRTWEWSEEYYRSGRRLISGYSDSGGASRVDWLDAAYGSVGFRPLVVFSP